MLIYLNINGEAIQLDVRISLLEIKSSWKCIYQNPKMSATCPWTTDVRWLPSYQQCVPKKVQLALRS